MPEFLQNIGLEVPFTLVLLALLGLRAPVKPVASVWIKATAADVFALIDLFDGKVQNWGSTTVSTHAIDPAQNLFRMAFATTLSTGSVQSSEALFHIVARQENVRIEIDRAGLDGKSHNNELMKIVHHVSEEAGGTRLTTIYHWGPRPYIAQLLARADLWGGAYRLKGMAETGKPVEWPHTLISCLVAVLTGLLSVFAFSMTLGIEVASLLVLALLVHEFGHLLAFRLIGQPWGRIIFLPFIGALAVPRLAYQTQAQAVFAALMGPGFSVPLVLLCAIPWLLGDDTNPHLASLGLVAAALNLFNLIPAEPLDGGVALRSVLSRLIGRHAHWGLLILGAGLVLIGAAIGQIILMIFGGIAVLLNLRDRKIDHGLTPLSSLHLAIFAFSYVAIFGAHLTLLRYFYGVLYGLQS